MTVISLMTDFGIRDGNVGVMKAVIWDIAPQAQISDLSHMIEPQNVRQAALILGRSVPYFPTGSVHIVVVDPGVGTERRPIAARVGTQRFVGPDNGVLTDLLDRAEAAGWPVQVVHLDQPEFWLPEVSSVFHGRDIFSPVGAHLAAGVGLEKLGTPIEDPVRIDLPRPEVTEAGFRARVIHIDHFGNIATNLDREDLEGVSELEVRLRGRTIPGLYETFGQLPPGSLMVLYGSTGRLIISEVNGSAARALGAEVDDPVEVIVKG